MSWTQWDENFMKYVTYSRNYTSGMLQSWNKFCFTGGVLEMAVQVPTSSGLWPAAWLMGNLGRATFEATTSNMWPWSYSKCGEVTYINEKQKINACSSASLPHAFGLNPHQGRGAPEIDIFEIMTSADTPALKPSSDPDVIHQRVSSNTASVVISSSLHVSPGIQSKNRPKNGFPMSNTSDWYESLRLNANSSLNYDFWGEEIGLPSSPKKSKYMADAVTSDFEVPAAVLQGTHKYRLEWQPGSQGYLEWYLDDKFLFGIDAFVLANATGAIIPEEPAYFVINTAMSHIWGMPQPCDVSRCNACYSCYDCTNPDCQCSLPLGMQNCANLPAHLKVDYIRLYQDTNNPLHSTGCSPASHPTKEYISAHANIYADWTPLKPSSFVHALNVILPILILISLCLSLFYSARYLFSPRYRTVGDVRNVTQMSPIKRRHKTRDIAHLHGERSRILPILPLQQENYGAISISN